MKKMVFSSIFNSIKRVSNWYVKSISSNGCYILFSTGCPITSSKYINKEK